MKLQLLLVPAVAGTIKFIFLEFVTYSGERGVLCVGNGSHNFCTPVLMNMSNITFQVLRLSTFVFNRCSGIIIFTIICVVKSIIGALRILVGKMLTQRCRRWPSIISYLGSGLSGHWG